MASETANGVRPAIRQSINELANGLTALLVRDGQLFAGIDEMISVFTDDPDGPDLEAKFAILAEAYVSALVLLAEERAKGVTT